MLGAKVGKPLSQSVQEGHYDKGDLFIAIDPSAFGNTKVFREMVEAHVAEVKSIRKAPRRGGDSRAGGAQFQGEGKEAARGNPGGRWSMEASGGNLG